MENTIFTPLGKEIEKCLVDTDRAWAWLIEQVQGTTGLYFGRSYTCKTQTGQLATPKIIRAIQDILNLSEQRQDTKAEG